MPTLFSDNAQFHMDDAAASIADIGVHVSSLTINGGNETEDDTGLGTKQRTAASGLYPAQTVDISFKVNSTTRTIFWPLINGTSITKTISVSHDGVQYQNGEAWPTGVSFSSPIGMQTGSCSFVCENGLTNTSVVAS